MVRCPGGRFIAVDNETDTTPYALAQTDGQTHKCPEGEAKCVRTMRATGDCRSEKGVLSAAASTHEKEGDTDLQSLRFLLLPPLLAI